MSARRNARRRAIQADKWIPGKREADEGGAAPAGSRKALTARRIVAKRARR